MGCNEYIHESRFLVIAYFTLHNLVIEGALQVLNQTWCEHCVNMQNNSTKQATLQALLRASFTLETSYLLEPGVETGCTYKHLS